MSRGHKAKGYETVTAPSTSPRFQGAKKAGMKKRLLADKRGRIVNSYGIYFSILKIVPDLLRRAFLWRICIVLVSRKRIDIKL